MAVDDLTQVFSANLSAGSTVDRQPSAGVEEMLLDIGTAAHEGSGVPYFCPAAKVQRIDGTNNEAIILDGNGGLTSRFFARLPIMATNTNYWRFTNQGSTGDLVLAVIQQG